MTWKGERTTASPVGAVGGGGLWAGRKAGASRPRRIERIGVGFMGNLGRCGKKMPDKGAKGAAVF